MSIEDYALNLLLVAMVVRQIRGKRLTPAGLLWPVALVVAAAVKYLHGVPTTGNDLALAVAGAVAGTALGAGCGVLTRVDRAGGAGLVARATGAAATLWILGTGARMAFALYAENGGAPVIARFSAAHGITGASAWTAGLLLMSLSEVVARTLALTARAWAARGAVSA